MIPTIGKKTARTIAFYLVCEDNFCAMQIASNIEAAVSKIKRCSICKNISEHELCDICSDESRLKDKICVVSGVKDIMVIEEGGFYDGRYFVFEDSQNDIEQLKKAAKDAKEIIFAFAPSIANDALMYFIQEKLSDLNLSFSKIAQGVPTGVSLENVDTLSLIRAIMSRSAI